MMDQNYILIKPNEVRKKFVEYVLQNKARAMLPSRLPRMTKGTYYNDSDEESKAYVESDYN